jgi:uncharacterized protein YraI
VRSVRLVKIVLVVLMFVAGTFIGLVPAAAESSYPVVPAGHAVNVRSGPSTSAHIVGHLGASDRVSIECTARGTRVTGSLGTSDLWDKIAGGGDRWIADQFVRTGSDGPVAPACGVATRHVPEAAPPCSTAPDYVSVNRLMRNLCDLPSVAWDLPGLTVLKFGTNRPNCDQDRWHPCSEIRGILDARGAGKTCSTPPGTPGRDFFSQACAMHDYGYALIRVSLYPREAKWSIDELFRQVMYLQCNTDSPPLQGNDLITCKKFADDYWYAVKAVGGFFI